MRRNPSKSFKIVHGMFWEPSLIYNVVSLMSHYMRLILPMLHFGLKNSLVQDRLVRNFLRVRVLLDVTKPLATGVWMNRKELGNIWVFFKYEKLQNFCYGCGKIDHKQKSCNEAKAVCPYDTTKSKYGAFLGTSQVRSLIEEVEGSKQNHVHGGGKQNVRVEERENYSDNSGINCNVTKADNQGATS
ncbi:hypothetical protein Patl1_13275 [Pistacia atlantica]|uniref:Uncharacterized protein n=1 Tax=Pistacia atlantica TaxID=434234 RepID=A0ACC1AU52_9ROSI|nr:hypothetical protein Patl1_13275 [Pistacia atlantica]